MKPPKSELAWKLQDYLDAGVEPPERLMRDPEACEAILMTDGEIEVFLKDGIATTLILQDKKSPRYEDVRDNFLADLQFLVFMERISNDEYNEIVKLDEYKF